MKKILLCNDDGVNAKGIRVLYEYLSRSFDVTIVAPSTERSATGQTLTLDHPIRLEKLEEKVYQISGYPADCALIGILEVMKEMRPDVVISGINRGANLGQDIYYSGTVAAARQASFHHIPAIAISTVLDHFKGEDHEHIFYETAANLCSKIVSKELYKNLGPFEILNINVPNLSQNDIKGIKLTDLGRRLYSEEVEKRHDFKGREYFWIGGRLEGHEGGPNSDGQAIENKEISISLLNLFNQSTDTYEKWTKLIRNID